ncbi:hypothetical protein N7468_006585 [Penicillium chermesinum]|uniref:Opine dehydrogenase domain-containing protein n=1 Tax=Penicillium chermesinum TaxID=63820 RepID=A0A9W9NSI2_9EURO|nr:uncharacterized protein N7468_006585 [Penicillium chermesinum]KAJ5225360.1 hypothetical protein N7468_006585 [Penicillium chermesinum]KAJ6161413.1 hypothetical protein N7470_004809 [Penicillium chermesinum]
MAIDTSETVPSVSIIGAGPCGCAFAADLASKGRDVLLYAHPEHRGFVPLIENNGGWLGAKGEVNGQFQIPTTSDMSRAVHHANYLIVTVPSFGQDTILTILSQFDLRKHTLIINVGNFFYLAARQKVNASTIVETDISPYACRMVGNDVFIKGTKKRLAIWAEKAPFQDALKPQGDQLFRRQIQSVFTPELVWTKNLLEVGLNNINPVVHAPAVLMNAGWIESTKGDFYFYGQGMSPAVSRVSEKIDQERLAIARAYGLELVDITTYMNRNYSHDKEYQSFHDFASQSWIHNQTKGAPTHMGHRYVTEDIRYGLVPWYELGVKCGLASPTIRSLIEVASVVGGVDSFATGRSLQAAGLGEATKEQVLMALGGPMEMTPGILPPLSEPPVKMMESRVSMQATRVAA